jgi:hypothetical protein
MALPFAGVWFFLQRQHSDPVDGNVPSTQVAEFLEKTIEDFPIDFQIIGGPYPTVNGVMQIPLGSEVRYSIKADNVDRDVYIGVWDCKANGEMMQLIPLDGKPIPVLKKGEHLMIPEKPTESFEVVAGSGTECLLVMACTKPWDIPTGKKDGPFAVFNTGGDKQRLIGALSIPRSMRFKAEAEKPLLSEKVIKYQVVPARP